MFEIIKLFLKHNLDILLQLHIKASNEANSDKYATQRLIIHVEDQNDNHPIFTNPKINGTTHWQYMTENKTVLKIEVSLYM